jgi:hypothetical protein
MPWVVKYQPDRKKPKPCHKLPSYVFRPVGQIIYCDKCGKTYQLVRRADPMGTHLEWLELHE